MKVMEEQWINDLRHRFADREEPAPDGLWDSIEAAMTDRGLGFGPEQEPQPKARIVPMWVRRAVAVAACVVVIIGVGTVMLRQNGEDGTAPTTLAADETGSPVQRNTATQSAAEAAMDVEGQSLVAQAVSRLSAAVAHATDRQTENAAEEQPVLLAEATAATAETETAVAQTEEGEAEKQSVVITKQPTDNGRKPSSYTAQRPRRLPATSSSGGRQGVSLGVYGMGLTAMGGGSALNNGLLYSQGMQSDAAFTDVAVLMTSPSKNGIEVSIEPDEVKVKHRQPVKAGLSARFLLDDRWGVETGLYYTYLSSDFVSGDNNRGSKTEQRLHYIGVPVKATYSVWKNNRLDVYVGAGGSVEVGVSGTARTEQIANGSVRSTEEESMKDSRPQFSLNASAGVQYSLSRRIGVYAEPGVGWYIDNGSSIQNVYKDKPWNLSLSLGLRYTFE